MNSKIKNTVIVAGISLGLGILGSIAICWLHVALFGHIESHSWITGFFIGWFLRGITKTIKEYAKSMFN